MADVMNMEKIRTLSDDQLQAEVLKLRGEQMNLRFQKATGQMEKPNRWREVKTQIAQLKTEQSARRSAASN